MTPHTGNLDSGDVYRGLELPPRTAGEQAGAERRARLEEQQRLAAELRYWGWVAAERPGPRGHR